MKTSIWLKLFGILAAIALSMAIVTVTDSDHGLIVLLVAMVTLLMGLAFLTRAEKRLPLLCDPMCLMIVFCSQFFIVGPLCLPAFDYHIFYHLSIGLVAKTLCAFLVMFLCFYVAYQSPFGAVIAERLPDFRGGRLKLPGRWAEWFVLGASLIGIAVFFYHRGGIVELLSLGYGRAKYSGLYQLPFHTLILGTIMMAWRITDQPKPNRFDVGIFAALLVSELFFYGIVLGVRNRLLFLFFSLYTIWILRRGFTRMVKLSLVPILAGLVLFFAFWATIRARPVTELVQGRWNPQYQKLSVSMGYMKSVTEPFAVACIVMDLFPDVEPYRYGRTLLVTLLAFIPRAVWPDKPIGFGKEITKYTDGIWYDPRQGHSLTVTLVGDFYVNGGWFAVVFGGLVFGLLCRVVASYTAAGMVRGGIQVNAARVLLAAVFAAGMAEVRSDSSTFLMYHGMMTLWLILTLAFFRVGGDATYARARAPSTAEREPQFAPS